MTGRARTPIIALTANAMPHQVAEYLAAGMDGHVAKPIKARLLLEALQTAKEAGTADHRGGAGDSVHHLTRKIGGSAGA